MAVNLVVTLPSRLGPRRRDPSFIATDGTRWTPPWWPQEADNSEYGRIWDEVDRPQRRPLVRHAGDGLHRVGIELRVWRDGLSVESDLQQVRKLTSGGFPVRIDGAGPSLLGWWLVDRPSWPILQTNEQMEATDAVVRMSLRRAEQLASYTPITAGGADEIRPSARPGGVSTVVADGQPLPRVAFAVYGDPARWREIADANGIINPALVQAGTVLRIP